MKMSFNMMLFAEPNLKKILYIQIMLKPVQKYNFSLFSSFTY